MGLGLGGVHRTGLCEGDARDLGLGGTHCAVLEEDALGLGPGRADFAGLGKEIGVGLSLGGAHRVGADE